MKQKQNAIERRLGSTQAGSGTERAESGDPEFDALVSELTQLIADGGLPEGFDLQEAAKDAALVELMQQYGAAAGIRIYIAERRAEEAEEAAMQRLSTQLRSRNAVPKSTRSGGAGGGGTNYRSMDGEAFRALLQQMKKTARDGGKTRL